MYFAQSTLSTPEPKQISTARKRIILSAAYSVNGGRFQFSHLRLIHIDPIVAAYLI